MRASQVVLLGASIGLLWAVLYPHPGVWYSVGLVLIHALAAGLVALASFWISRRLEEGVSLGAAVGALWVAPILLFLIDFKVADIRTELSGFLWVVLVVAASSIVGAAIGGLAGRAGRLATLVAVAAFGLAAVALSYFILGEPPTPKITLVDRSGPSPISTEPPGRVKVMVLGIDGGTWNAIVPLLKAGKLPHLRGLMEKGRYGVLESVLSASGETASPVVWTSIFTGVRPEGHGITDWMTSDSRNRRRKSLWNILNDLRRQALVVNVPATFPPEVVKGASISGFPTPLVVTPTANRLLPSEGRVYSTHPERFRIVPATRLTLEKPRSPGDTVAVEIPVVASLETQHGRLRHPAYDFRFGNLFLELAERRRFLPESRLARYRGVVMAGASSPELHLFDDARGASPLAKLSEGEWTDWLSTSYRGVELRFRFRLNEISDDRLEIYSTPLNQSASSPVIPFFYPEEIGPLLSASVDPYVVEGAGWRMYEDESLIDALYEQIDEVGRRHFEASTLLLSSMPEWSLFAHVFTESDRIQHPLWRFHEPDAFEAVDPALAARHGEKVSTMMETIDQRIGKLLEYADEDTVVAVVSDHGFEPGPKTGRGEHSTEGIFILAGKGVAEAGSDLDLEVERFERASVLDVMPTLLCLMGYPQAKDLDGKPLPDLLPTPCAIDAIDSYETGSWVKGGHQTLDESTLDQLRSLGYVR